MKKIKLIPFLLAAPLLVGCGVSKPRAPKFLEMTSKDKVTGSAFITSLQKVQDEHEFYVDKLLPSSVVTFEAKTNEEKKVEFKGKVKSKEQSIRNAKRVAKLDKANKILTLTHEEKEASSKKTKESKSSGSLSDKTTYVYQEAKVDNVNYVVKVNKELKEFNNYNKLGSNKAEKVLDNKMKDLCVEWSGGENELNIEYLLSGFSVAQSAEDKAEMAKYSFYIKGKVYTAEYASEEKDVDVKDYTDTVVGKRSSKTFVKVQVDITEGKSKVTKWSTMESTKTNKKDYNEKISWDEYVPHYKDEVEKGSSQILEVTSFEHKENKQKAVDISKFTQIGTDW